VSVSCTDAQAALSLNAALGNLEDRLRAELFGGLAKVPQELQALLERLSGGSGRFWESRAQEEWVHIRVSFPSAELLMLLLSARGERTMPPEVPVEPRQQPGGEAPAPAHH